MNYRPPGGIEFDDLELLPGQLVCPLTNPVRHEVDEHRLWHIEIAGLGFDEPCGGNPGVLSKGLQALRMLFSAPASFIDARTRM
jgi:hypothetical protein